MEAQDGVEGQRASDISVSIEEAIREGRLTPGAQLPTVRSLADRLNVSPSTISAAYRYLRQRGVISTHGRGGTRVHSRPPLDAPGKSAALPADPSLRDVGQVAPPSELAQITRDALTNVVETREVDDEGQLERRLAKDLDAAGIESTSVVAVASAREALTRVLEAHLLPGDRIAIEDPTGTIIRDVVSLTGLEAVGIQMDSDGPNVRSLTTAVARSKAVVLTPRAHDPTGAAIDATRAAAIRSALHTRPDVLVLEWDPVGDLAGIDLESISDPAATKWAHIRSYHDLFVGQADLASLTGDPITMSRVKGRQLLGGTHLTPLARMIALQVLDHPGTHHRTEGTARHLGTRRVMLMAALRHRGIDSSGTAGPYVWIPTDDQEAAIAAMAQLGWLVTGGEQADDHGPQGLRIAADTLDATSGSRFADDLLEVLADL